MPRRQSPSSREQRLARAVVSCVVLAVCSDATAQLVYRFERLWPVLQQPWYFFRPAGVAIDNSGNLFVADTSNNRIRKFTSDGQFITQWGRGGVAPGEFDWPTGIAIGPDKLVYVADRNIGRIQVFDGEGTLVRMWTTHEQPTGVAIDDAGNVFVTFGDNLRVQKYAPDGILLDEFIGDGSTSLPPGSPCGPGALLPCEWAPGLAVDKLGHIFVSDSVNLRIIRLNSDLEFEFAFGDDGQPQGSAGTRFGPSFGLAVDRDGNVYATDVFNGRIHKFDNSGDFLGILWGEPGNGPGQFGAPHGIAIDSVGSVYVTDTTNDRLQKFTPDGGFITQFGSLSTRPGAFDKPGDAAIAVDGAVFVADTTNSRIEKFSANGQFLLSWGVPGRGLPHSFVNPQGLAMGPDGNVYIADTGSGDDDDAPRIAVFDSQGAFVREWDIPNITGDPVLPDEYVQPTGIAVDTNGNVYVCQTSLVRVIDPDPGSNNDPVRHRVQKFTLLGTLLAQWGSFGEDDGQFLGPAALDVDADGNVYVVESGSVDCTNAQGDCPLPNTPPRVQKFTADGDFLLSWGGFGTEPGRFDSPGGIAIDDDGNVLVSDSMNNRIQKFTPNGSFIQQWGGQGDSPGQFLRPAGLDVAPDGAVYVADHRHSRVQQFRPVSQTVQDKAIIVAGDSVEFTRLRGPTQMCANFAYRAFVHQGFTKDTIRYLSFDTDFDLDSNGLDDDILDANAATLEESIVTWAADARNAVVYLTGPTASDRFLLDGTESVAALTLDTWLDALQQTVTGTLLIVIDVSGAGAFLPKLTGPDNGARIVIASTASGEPAFFVTGGTLSYSNHLWLGIFNGADILDAHTQARNAVALATGYQNPLLDANGNGAGNEQADFDLAGNVTFFDKVITFDSPPAVESVSPPQQLTESESAASFFADGVIDDQAAIARVWAVVTPPGGAKAVGDTVLDLPTFDLAPAGDGSFAGDFDGFALAGEYAVDIYAIDGNLNIAGVQRTAVTKAGLLPGAVVCIVWNAATLERILNATAQMQALGLSVSANVDGVYAIPALPVGSYTVLVTAPGYVSQVQPIDVVGGDVATLDFPMTPLPDGYADIDSDGQVDAVDIQLVINAALGLPATFDCDVDNNGSVEAVDVQLVVNAALQIK